MTKFGQFLSDKSINKPEVSRKKIILKAKVLHLISLAIDASSIETLNRMFNYLNTKK